MRVGFDNFDNAPHFYTPHLKAKISDKYREFSIIWQVYASRISQCSPLLHSSPESEILN
jgi:hypothetical protein